MESMSTNTIDSITVISSPSCQPCASLKAWLVQGDIPFIERSIVEEDVQQIMVELKARTVPTAVVVVGGISTALTGQENIKNYIMGLYNA